MGQLDLNFISLNTWKLLFRNAQLEFAMSGSSGEGPDERCIYSRTLTNLRKSNRLNHQWTVLGLSRKSPVHIQMEST